MCNIRWTDPLLRKGQGNFPHHIILLNVISAFYSFEVVCVDLDVTGFYSSKVGPSSQHTLLGLLLKERKADGQDKSSPSPNFACTLRRLKTWGLVFLHFLGMGQ